MAKKKVIRKRKGHKSSSKGSRTRKQLRRQGDVVTLL